MASSCSSCLRVPRPKTFLGLLSLQTGTELVSLALLINKAICVYGLLAVLTGYSLSALQWSMYIYSLLLAAVLAYLIRHIRKQSPVENIALAWLYVVDTVINGAFTTAFAVHWFLAIFHDPEGTAGAEAGPVASSETDRRDDGYAVQSGVADTPTSIVLIVVFTFVRIYFSFVIMSYAKMVLQRSIDVNAGDGDESLKGVSRDPFAPDSLLGKGFRGKLGRAMTAVGKGYWLGQSKEDEEWAQAMSARFGKTKRPVSTPSGAGPSGQ